MSRLTLVLVILKLLTIASGARILAVFPYPSLSHQVVFRRVTLELVKQGHEVFVITPDPAFPKGQAPDNLTEIDVHDVAYTSWMDIITRYVAGAPTDSITQTNALIRFSVDLFEHEMAVDEVKEIIDKKKGDFDLVITELCVRPALGFSHIYKAPVIQMSSLGSILFADERIGAASHPLIYPNFWSRRIYNLTITEKIKELWTYWSVKSFFESQEKHENEVIKKVFGQDAPPLSELVKNVDMMMLNMYPIWLENQPLPPNVILMGGIHQQPSKPLPTEYQTYLDSSKHGVIYVSFGSNVVPSAFPPEVVDTLLSVLSETQYDVLLKWDKEVPVKYKNIKVSTWFPQADILGHPKVKLFVTQGGLQSTDEAITAGVPLIGIPVLGDQWYNTEKYTRHRIGLHLDMNNFTKYIFKNAIETVINDKSYRVNMIKMRDIVTDQPQKPLERAIWWIEHVLRHKGASHLKAPTKNMRPYEYFEMDLIITVFFILMTMLLCICCVIYIMWLCIQKRVCRKTKQS